MLKPTNDPIDVMRREMADYKREIGGALDAGGTQPFQTVRKVQAQIDELRELLIRMPTYEGRQLEADSWGNVSGSWLSILTATIPRPTDKTRVVISANAMVSGMAATGGLLGFNARLVVNGAASPVFRATTEGAMATTRAVTYPSFVREIAPLTGSVTVSLQVDVVANSFPLDRAVSLSILAGFSTI